MAPVTYNLTQAEKTLVRKYFDLSTYLKYNTSLPNTTSADAAFNVYINGDFQNGVPASPIFMQKDYAANNPDLMEFAHKNNWKATDYLRHYDSFGRNEGRVASHLFNANDYLAAPSNADLVSFYNTNSAAYPDLNMALANHFLTYGRNEVARTGTYVALAHSTDYTKTNAYVASSGSVNPNTIIVDGFEGKSIGTNADDTFSDANNNVNSSYTSVDGGNGRNTFKLGGFTSTIAPTLSNIQNLLLRPTNASAVFDATNSPDLSRVSLYNPATNATVSNLDQSVKFNVTGSKAGTHTFKTKSASPDTTKPFYVSLDGAMSTVSIQNSSGVAVPVNMSINAINNASTVALDDTVQNIVVKGDASLNLTSSTGTNGAFGNLINFDSSSNSKNITVKTAASATNAVIKTGAGNDQVTRANLDSSDIIDLGAGDNALYANSANLGSYTPQTPAQIKNVHYIGSSDSLAANLDVSKFGAKTANITAGSSNSANYTVSNVQAGETVLFQGSIGGASNNLTVSLASGATSSALTFNMNDSANSTSYLATSVENLTVQASVPTKTATVNLTDSALKTLTVNGQGSVDLTGAALNNTVTKIDATSLVGAFNVKLATTGATGVTVKGSLTGTNLIFDSNGNDTIIGGGANDTFITSTGRDTITGNGGSNTYNIGSGLSGSYSNANIVKNKVTITDFNAGGAGSGAVDKLGFSVAAFSDTPLMKGAGTSVASTDAVNPYLVTTVNAGTATLGSTNNAVFYTARPFASSTEFASVINSNASKISYTSPAAAKAFLAVYQNSTDKCLDVALVKVVSGTTDTYGTGSATPGTTGLATVTDIVKLSGVTDFTNFDATDFVNFIS